MGAMERLHPLAAAGYFAGVAAVAMVSMNPVLLGLSLLGSLALSCRYGGLRGQAAFCCWGFAWRCSIRWCIITGSRRC